MAITTDGDDVKIFNIEEKQTDVNLAVAMVKDALCQNHDCVLLVSNDSDFTGALKIVKEYKEVVLFNPRGGKAVKNLKSHADDEIIIEDRMQLFANSQLPDPIVIKKKTCFVVIHKRMKNSLDIYVQHRLATGL